MAILDQSPLRTGARPVLKQEKSYKPGDDLFVEGTRGDEMFIILEGEVAILKKNDESFVELARLSKGANIGEMALLDDMPRSATVRATQPTKVTVINRLAFNTVMEKVPLWLRSIVRIVSSRLRDANTRVGQSILRDLECGVCSIVVMMVHRWGKLNGDGVILPYAHLKNFALFTSRLSSKAFASAVDKLVKRSLVNVEKDSTGAMLFVVKDLPALKLFIEYRRLCAQGKKWLVWT